MKNEIYAPSSELSMPVPAGAKSGQPIKIGSLVGVLATDEGKGGNAAGYASVLMDDRGYLFDVDGAITGAGQEVFITAGRTLTTTGPANGVFGYTVPGPNNAYATKAAGVGKAVVKLAKV